jgi:hypothetical protein
MQIASEKTRQVSSDLALKILNSDSEQTVPSDAKTAQSQQSSSPSSIAPEMPKSQANVTASWMRNLAAEIGLPAGYKQVWTQPSRLDVTSDSFKDYLRGAQETAKGWSPYAGEIIDALDAGTLTIESPETNPWDIAFYHEDGREAGYAMKYDDEVWMDFLNDHLARDENGNYARTASGAYIDKATGQSADMGQIGGNCYYMTWPTPS